jgi:hypothetical protein
MGVLRSTQVGNFCFQHFGEYAELKIRQKLIKKCLELGVVAHPRSQLLGGLSRRSVVWGWPWEESLRLSPNDN